MQAESHSRIRGFLLALKERRRAQDARDALGGYVEARHPEHPDTWSLDRQAALAAIEADLVMATRSLVVLREAYVDDSRCRLPIVRTDGGQDFP